MKRALKKPRVGTLLKNLGFNGEAVVIVTRGPVALNELINSNIIRQIYANTTSTSVLNQYELDCAIPYNSQITSKQCDLIIVAHRPPRKKAGV